METRKRGERAHLQPSMILDVACDLVARHGFADVSFQMIAKEVGVSQSTIMHYFPNKLALIRALIEHIVQQNHAYVSAMHKVEHDGFTRLKNHFLGNLKWANENPAQGSVILLLYYMGSVNKEFGNLYGRILANARLRVAEHVLAAQREGLIELGLPVELVVELLQESLLGSLLNLGACHSLPADTAIVEKKWNGLFAKLLTPRPQRRRKRSSR